MEIFDQKLLDRIARKLIQRKMTIAIAESVTGGLVQFAFSNMTQAMKFFQGGTCVYNLGQKYKHLNVEPIHAEQVNSVSHRVAQEMAINVARMFNSNFGIGITGFATPVPESANKVYAYFSIAKNNKEMLKGRINIKKTSAMQAQEIFTNKILAEFSGML